MSSARKKLQPCTNVLYLRGESTKANIHVQLLISDQVVANQTTKFFVKENSTLYLSRRY